MKVSVVIPVYNGEKHLRQTLESVLAQTCPPSEIIIVNDGSTDGSLAILSEYDGPIRILHQNNCGVSQARNRGVEESTGELIALLDQDDIWYREKVEKQVKVFTEHPDVSFVYSDVDFMDPSGTLLEKQASGPWQADWIRPLLKGHFHPYPSTVMIKRDFYIAQGGFSTDFIKNTHEDVEFWARLSTVTDFHFIEEPLVQYRVDLWKAVEREGDNCEYRWQNMLTLYKTLLRIYQTNPKMKKYSKKVLKIEARMEAARLSMLGKKYLLNGDVEGARKKFQDACRLDNKTKYWSRYIRSLFPGRFLKHLFPK